MIIAEEVGTTYTAGAYTVRISLRPDNPAFARYLVFKFDKLVGRQFSRPSETDCQWLERCCQYATESHCATFSDGHPIKISRGANGHFGGGKAFTVGRRGRPRRADAERQLQEALPT